jgi:hypothetical protein
MCDVLDAYISETRSLRANEITWLLERGVPPLAIGTDPNENGFALAFASVVTDDNGFYFASERPDERAHGAFIIVVRDEDGDLADLTAWRPKDRLLANWRGSPGLLGAQHVHEPRMGEPLAIMADPLDWLRRGRHGVVITDTARAPWALLDAGTLAAQSKNHAIALKRTFTAIVPSILFPAMKVAA